MPGRGWSRSPKPRRIRSWMAGSLVALPECGRSDPTGRLNLTSRSPWRLHRDRGRANTDPAIGGYTAPIVQLEAAYRTRPSAIMAADEYGICGVCLSSGQGGPPRWSMPTRRDPVSSDYRPSCGVSVRSKAQLEPGPNSGRNERTCMLSSAEPFSAIFTRDTASWAGPCSTPC